MIFRGAGFRALVPRLVWGGCFTEIGGWFLEGGFLRAAFRGGLALL